MALRAGLVPPAPPPLDRRTYRVLSSASRVRLLEALQSEGPLEAHQLAVRLGLHRNTVRAHLDVLLEARLVSARTLPPTGPGRPRLAYAATHAITEDRQTGSYRLLAQILASSLEEGGDGPQRAVAAGRCAGQEVVRDTRPNAEGIEGRRAGVLALLDRLGFAPRPAGKGASGETEVIELHHCPFHDLAETRSSIVCSAHRGLLEGACERLGGRRDSVRLIPFAKPGLCAVQIERP
jgi:predicted ArsR family transcriptional regulator